jgi:uncharacterized protein YjbI with pentapeptide repeats
MAHFAYNIRGKTAIELGAGERWVELYTCIYFRLFKRSQDFAGLSYRNLVEEETMSTYAGPFLGKDKGALTRADVEERIQRAGKSEHVDLTGEDLSGADLSNMKLTGTIFRRADLSGANLSGANLNGPT